MKSLLAVFLALVAVAQAANEIQSFTITSREGNTLGFTVLVNQAAEPVILTFTVTDTAGPTEVNKQTETIDTTMVQGSRTFSFNGFIPGVRYAVRVEAALQSAPNSPTDAETINANSSSLI